MGWPSNSDDIYRAFKIAGCRHDGLIDLLENEMK
jgi:hypothetical protein